MVNETDVYTITVEGPDGQKKTVKITSDQVDFYRSDRRGGNYATATWLAYCDLWAQS
jgi:hypothetical protein